MLSLRQQIGGHESRVGAGIGDNKNFRRAGRHVDGYAVFGRRQLLGSGNIAVAWTKYLINGRHTGGAQRQGRYRLRATSLHDRSDSQQLGYEQDNRAHRAIGLGWGANHHLGTTGQPGRHPQHEQGTEQRSRAPRYV